MSASPSRLRYERTFVVFVALFTTSLVTCNLIFKKFFIWRVWVPGIGDYDFQQSVGILPYPVTFLVTDILSEVYGKRRANQVVLAGFFASMFALLILLLADTATQAPWSVPAEGWVDDTTFSLVFGQAWVAMTASMAAYLTAQFLDVQFFHFWRRLTGGRHLWLRNNASTISSQVIDTFVVLFLLAWLGRQEEGVTFDSLPVLFLNGVLFKMLVALVDTPFFYAAVHLFRRWFPQEMEAAHADEDPKLEVPPPFGG